MKMDDNEFISVHVDKNVSCTIKTSDDNWFLLETVLKYIIHDPCITRTDLIEAASKWESILKPVFDEL